MKPRSAYTRSRGAFLSLVALAALAFTVFVAVALSRLIIQQHIGERHDLIEARLDCMIASAQAWTAAAPNARDSGADWRELPVAKLLPAEWVGKLEIRCFPGDFARWECRAVLDAPTAHAAREASWPSAIGANAKHVSK